MRMLHGTNIWRDARLASLISHLGIVGVKDPDGSPLDVKLLRSIFAAVRPKLFLEVGVFRGATSIRAAKLLARLGLRSSYVISMDSWLFDLRFVWDKTRQRSVGSYFSGNAEVAGSSQMYYQFLANCLASNTSSRIIPLPSSSTNGAMALLAHRLRPDVMYVSHANPDCYIDYENLYQLLAPGGAFAADDVHLPAVRDAWNALLRRYSLNEVHYVGNGTQAWFRKPMEGRRQRGAVSSVPVRRLV